MDDANNGGIWWLNIEQRTVYDQDDENVLKCVEARTVEEAVGCYPSHVVRPWEYQTEIGGPKSIRLKKAVLERDVALESRKASESGSIADNRHAVCSIVIAVILAVIIYCMERFLEQQYAGKNWYVLTAIVLFLGMIADLCYLFLAHTELDLYGIGAAILITVIYTKFMHRMPVFIGMMALCLAGCLYYFIDTARIRDKDNRRLRDCDRKISAAADSLLSGLKDNINAFAGEWAATSEEADQIWHEAARRVCAGLDETWKKISSWEIDHGEAILPLSPVWKNTSEKHEMWSEPDSIWWANMDPDTPDVYAAAMRRGVKSEKDLEFMTAVAEEGYLRAINDLTLEYFNTGTVKQDRLMAMLWAGVGCGISSSARFLEAVGEYRFFDVQPAEPLELDTPPYLLGACWEVGNAIISSDEKKAQEMMNLAAMEGNSYAKKWLTDRGIKIKTPFG